MSKDTYLSSIIESVTVEKRSADRGRTDELRVTMSLRKEAVVGVCIRTPEFVHFDNTPEARAHYVECRRREISRSLARAVTQEIDDVVRRLEPPVLHGEAVTVRRAY